MLHVFLKAGKEFVRESFRWNVSYIKLKYVTYVSMILIVHYVHIQRDYLMAEKNVNQMRKSIAIYVVRI